MNKIKTIFSIKDLENLSGVKAHTIRIWEKRYEIFNPNRNQINIRSYSLEELQKLLNIAFLNEYGYKISRIAQYSDNQLKEVVKQIYSEKTNASYSLKVLKVAMLNFDAVLFNETYNELRKTKSFDVIFEEVFVPFLYEIGVLWQTETIKPIHEHFISYHIYQKLVAAGNELICNQDLVLRNVDFILFLPENEIHEITLLYLNFKLLQKGYNTIYLGVSTPFEDLEFISKTFPAASFVSYFTVMPTLDNLKKYLTDFNSSILENNGVNLYVAGRQVGQLESTFSKIYFFNSYQDLIKSI